MKGKALAEVSKILRKHQTPWESQLWYFLRGGRFYNLKFKRQVPMGDYVVDFCCQEKKLIIELDGGRHNQKESKISDGQRQIFLESNGYIVLRFWNNEFEKNIQGVLEVIRKAVSNN